MGSKKSSFNVLDLLLGLGLAALFPLAAYALLHQGEEKVDPAVEQARLGAPITQEELNDIREEALRMYQQNARLYLDRAPLDERYKAQEQAWARTTLELCRKRLTDLIARAKANPASLSVRDVIRELEGLLRKVDGDLRSVPAGAPAAAAAPPAAPPAPVPTAAAPPEGAVSGR